MKIVTDRTIKSALSCYQLDESIYGGPIIFNEQTNKQKINQRHTKQLGFN